MIKRILFATLLLISLYAPAQSEYILIDNASKIVPYTLFTPNQIANHLTKDLKTDIEKTRAIYIWITHNISYDVALLENLPVYYSAEEFVAYALENRSGICQHYSDLFLAMTQSIGLKTYLISGYTRDRQGKIAAVSHAWNAIQIDSKYYFIDTTWSAGHITDDRYIRKFNDNYFLITPEEFVKDHISFDPVWQFLSPPIRHKDFQEQNFEKLNLTSTYSFNDTINKLNSLARPTQLSQSISRIIHCGVTNNLIKEKIKNNLNIITSLEFNTVIDTLNFGINNYNIYIGHKNNKFRHSNLSDPELEELINNASLGINASNELIFGLSSTNKELSKSINREKDRIPDLVKAVETEKEFVAKYVKKWKPLRISMFYKFEPRKVNTTPKIKSF